MGDRRLRAIVDGVIAEGDHAESSGLEIKSDLDLTDKSGYTKVAKFILGMANRQPKTAAKHFQGYGVLVIGADRGAAPGVTQNTEAHQLADRLRSYLGPEPPEWDLARLLVSSGLGVLFIIVDPPKSGDPLFVCHGNYHPQGKDRKHGLDDGGIYVRDKTQTRKARGSEIVAIMERFSAASAPPMNTTVTSSGSALTLHDSEMMLERVLDGARGAYYKKREEAEENTRSPNPHFQALIAQQRTPHSASNRTDRPVDEVLADWEPNARRRWPEVLEQVAGAVWQPLGFTVTNISGHLKRPMIEVTIEDAMGVEDLDIEDVDFADMSLSVTKSVPPWSEQTRTYLQGVRHIWHSSEIEWTNTSAQVKIRLTPEALHPGTPWSPGYSDLVLIAKDPAAESLRATWSLTAEGVDTRHTGETTISVTPNIGVEGLYHRYLAARQRG